LPIGIDDMYKPYVFPLGEVKQPSGDLCFWDKSIFPIDVKRAFWISKVPEGGKRGVHAHYEDNQIIICLRGKVMVQLEDLNKETYSFLLNAPVKALFLPAMVWSDFTFEAGSVLLVLSSKEFTEGDYIRNKADFEKLQDGYRKEL